MGFISYSMSFYNAELQQLENGIVTEETKYRAQQLLKMLDDQIDEGYTRLNDKLEESFRGVTRLRKYLSDNHAEPFKLCPKPIVETDASYGSRDLELAEAINALCERAEHTHKTSDDCFLRELIRFCEWIGYEEDTAYIFLLRDTLLPYIYYKRNNVKEIYPWLLSRKALSLLAGKDAVDDEFRASVIKGLENGGQHQSFHAFCNVVLADIRDKLKKYPKIEICLSDLLKNITKKHIVVVESGCFGTFPMLLMSLDKRIELRMFTTYPYLSDIYRNKIYTTRYEENRLFETLYSQDRYFRFSDLRDGCFFVNKCENTDVEENAVMEVKTILKQ